MFCKYAFKDLQPKELLCIISLYLCVFYYFLFLVDRTKVSAVAVEIGVLPPVVALPRSYKYMRTYIYMYVCIYVYIYIYICMYVCIYIYIYICWCFVQRSAVINAASRIASETMHSRNTYTTSVSLGQGKNKQGITECKRNRMCLILCDVSFNESNKFRRCVTQRVDHKQRLM